MTEDKTYEQLKEQRDSILKRCAYWKVCNDGSYELALWESGYHEVCALIKKLEDNNGEDDATVSGNQRQDSQG